MLGLQPLGRVPMGGSYSLWVSVLVLPVTWPWAPPGGTVVAPTSLSVYLNLQQGRTPQGRVFLEFPLWYLWDPKTALSFLFLLTRLGGGRSVSA